MTPQEAIALAKEKGAELVDLKFMDLIGTWQHFTIPLSEYDEDLFEDGSGFDGSSIRGWQPINASDMLVMPDPSTAVMDPFYERPTLSLLCNIVDPITREPYSRDPRGIAKKAEPMSSPAASAKWRISDLSRNSSFLTKSVSIRMRMKAIITSIRLKASGTPAGKKVPILGISPGTKKATSRYHLSTRIKTSAPRWFR